MEFTQEELTAIKSDLTSLKSAKRRSAAKKIGKQQMTSLKDDLLEAYLRERKDSRTWETQTAMITALGKLKCQEALPYLKEIVDENKDADTITAYASLAYIRISRTHPNDMDVILRFLENGNTMVFDGAVMAMAWDDVVPAEEEMRRVIEMLERRKPVYERPFSNPIQQIISAMHKWPTEISLPFLNQYRDIPQYAHFVENTLSGKRSSRE